MTSQASLLLFVRFNLFPCLAEDLARSYLEFFLTHRFSQVLNGDKPVPFAEWEEPRSTSPRCVHCEQAWALAQRGSVGDVHDVGLVHGCHFLAPALLGQLEGVLSNAQGLGLGDDLQALHHARHTLGRQGGTGDSYPVGACPPA